MVPFRLDPVEKGNFVKGCQLRVYVDPEFHTDTFHALFYSYTALWG